MSLPYYPMYPRDFYEGTQEMTLEQKGAYIMVLNLMYTRGGPISDEPGFISRYIGCSITKWTGKRGVGGLRDQLIGMGKLTVGSGLLSNARADGELTKQRAWQDQQSENRSTPNKNKAEKSPPREQSKPEPKPVVVDDGEDARAPEPNPELAELQAKCRKWANGSLNLTSPGAHDLSPIIRLLNPAGGGKPCIVADVEAGITKTAGWLHRKGKQVGSLGYFENAIITERDKRLQPLPEPEINHERAGQGAGNANANGRGGVRSGPGRQHRPAGLSAAYERMFGGGEAPIDVSDRPEDGGGKRVA